MSTHSTSKTPHEIIEEEKEAYLDELPEPDPDWPTDVRAVYVDIKEHLFDFDLRIQDVRQRCGCYNNNISTRFRYFVGRGPKEHILHHRTSLARLLLRNKMLNVGDVAMGVGFSSPSAFSRAFKNELGCTPSNYVSEEKMQGDSKEEWSG